MALPGTFNAESKESVSKFSGFRWFLLFKATISRKVQLHLTGNVLAGDNNIICNWATFENLRPWFVGKDFITESWFADS